MNRLEQLQQLLNENSSDEFILFAIAKEYEKLGKDTEAFVYYKKLKGINPEYIGLYFHLAALYVKHQQFSEAIIIYDEGISIAKKVQDRHSLSELMGAKTNLEIEIKDFRNSK